MRDTRKRFAENLHIICEAAVHAVADAFALRAGQEVSGITGVALAANLASVIRNNTIADLPLCYVLADLSNHTGKLMTENHRRIQDFLMLSVVKRNIGAANACCLNFDEQIIIANFRNRHIT